MHPFMRRLSTLRICLTALSGTMITAIAGFAVHLWVSGAITVGAVAFTLSLMLRLNMLLGRLMMQLNAILRNLGVLENSKKLIAQPLGLLDAPDATTLDVTGGEIRARQCLLPLRQGVGRARSHQSRGQAGREGRAGRAVRRGQDHADQSDPAPLRRRGRPHSDRWPECCRCDADLAARRHRRGQPGYRAVPPLAARQHPAGHAERERRPAGRRCREGGGA